MSIMPCHAGQKMEEWKEASSKTHEQLNTPSLQVMAGLYPWLVLAAAMLGLMLSGTETLQAYYGVRLDVSEI